MDLDRWSTRSENSKLVDIPKLFQCPIPGARFSEGKVVESLWSFCLRGPTIDAELSFGRMIVTLYVR